MHVCIRLTIRFYQRTDKWAGLMQGAIQEQTGRDREGRRERIERGLEHNKATLTHNSHSQSLHVYKPRLTIFAYPFNAHTQLYIYMYADVWWMYQGTRLY